MPARQRYPAPHQQLLVLAMRARERGLPFDEFWEQAVPQPGADGKPPVLPRVGGPEVPDTVLWPRDTYDRKLAYRTILECRDAWERAYNGKPAAPEEAALRILAPLLSGDRLGNEAGAAVPSAA